MPQVQVAALFTDRVVEVLASLPTVERGFDSVTRGQRPAAVLWAHQETAELAASVRAFDAAFAICEHGGATKLAITPADDPDLESVRFGLSLLCATIETKRGNFQSALNQLDAIDSGSATRRLVVGNQRVRTLLDFGSIQRATAALAKARRILNESLEGEDDLDRGAAEAELLLNQGRLYLAQERPGLLRTLLENELSKPAHERSPVTDELRLLDLQGAIEGIYSSSEILPKLLAEAEDLLERLPHQRVELLITLYELLTAAEQDEQAGVTSEQLWEWVLNSPGAFASRTEEIFLSVHARRLIAAPRYAEFEQDAQLLLASMERCFAGVLDKWRGADATDSSASFVIYRSHRMLLGSMIRLAVELHATDAGERALTWLLQVQRSSGAVRNLVDRGIAVSPGGVREVQAALRRVPDSALLAFFGSNFDSWALLVTADQIIVRELPSYNVLGKPFRRLSIDLAALRKDAKREIWTKLETHAQELSKLVLAPLQNELQSVKQLGWVDVGLLQGFPATGLSIEGQTLGERLGVWTLPPLPLWLQRLEGKHPARQQEPLQIGVARLDLAPGATPQSTEYAMDKLAGREREVRSLQNPAEIQSWLRAARSADAALIAHGEFDPRSGSTDVIPPKGRFDVEAAFALTSTNELPATLLLAACGAGLHHDAVGEPIAASSLGGALVSAGVDQVIQSRDPLTLDTAIFLVEQWFKTRDGNATSPAERLTTMRNILVRDHGWSPLSAAMIELVGLNVVRR